MNRLLLCTDLDRTLLPNGIDEESEKARERFSELVTKPQVLLAYVTGRDQVLVEQAMNDYKLPLPDYVIANVGSTIYEINHSGWQHQSDWDNLIAKDWKGLSASDLHSLLHHIAGLSLQEKEKQNTYKLSYYVPLDVDHQLIVSEIETRLKREGVDTNIIWSVDAEQNIGLLDILPASAGKLQAIEFLMQYLGFDYNNTIFAGDSGNDICVLSSPIHSVLVANASSEVREAAIKRARENHQDKALYLAQGGFLDMNGNYSAGILEGVNHYLPETSNWFED